MLAHFFEEEGLPTTQISLVRLHTEITRPPRALWVSFELGRPLGVPNDPDFQKRVLIAALKLLEAPSGPVLEDYPEDAPASAGGITTLACPVNFTRQEEITTETEQLCAAFKREMVSLRPWYDMAAGKRGHTTVGVSGVDLDAIGDFLCSFLEGIAPENPREDISLAYTLNLVTDDLKAYYFEGITAQPGQESPSSQVLSDWFWDETLAAKVLLAIRDASKKSEDVLTQIVGKSLIIPAEVIRARRK
ncbi:hypothetical protein ACFLXV_00400 [Chloroflexota bacterium]